MSTAPSDDLARRHRARIVDSSDDAIVSKDLNGTIISWNAAAERMFGYSAAEAIGQSIRMIIPADRQHEEDFVLGQIRSGQTVRHFETVRQRKDGSHVPISLSVSPIYDDNGRIIGASKIARDITEYVRLRGAAEAQALINEKLGEIGAAVVASLDQDTIVQKVTELATTLSGAEFGAFFYLGAESSGADMMRTLAGSSSNPFAGIAQPQTVPLFAATFDGHSIRLADVTQDARFGGALREPDSRLRSYLAVPVKAVSGEILGGLFFGHGRPDFFTVLDEQLAAGIAAWSAVALENARLYSEARDADRLKDEFLAVLSHELRTPLNAIVGYARLLRAGILSDEKAARGLETLERNATALTQIVEDVLDVSRIISGKLRLDVQPVELPLVVHNAIATVQPAADAKRISVQTIVDPRVGPIAGDPNRLQQVIWNLLSNAVKFTPKDGRIQTRVEQVDSHVEIVISDTGMGIRRDFLPYVFDRFRQAEGGIARKTGGLGLGLSIVRHIVEMHGGSVIAESEGEGKGATFRVRLPMMIVRREAASEIRKHPRTEQKSPPMAIGQLRGTRVLAIDDDADALGLLRVVLEAAGAEVFTMGSANDALGRVATMKPDVLIVDLGMPTMDGFEFISRLRASSNADVRDIPAAALTAFARSEDRTKALQSGFEMHLAKPIDPGELVASVATLVRRSGRPR